jgi:hypothetical protein
LDSQEGAVGGRSLGIAGVSPAGLSEGSSDGVGGVGLAGVSVWMVFGGDVGWGGGASGLWVAPSEGCGCGVLDGFATGFSGWVGVSRGGGWVGFVVVVWSGRTQVMCLWVTVVCGGGPHPVISRDW